MKMKDYLENAYRINQRIDSKFEQLRYYQGLSTKVNSTISGMPSGASRNVHRMENIYVMIGDLEKEIHDDIVNLLNLKKSIRTLIESLDNREYQLVLELRYQCMKTWEQIAVDLGYNARHVRRLKDEAVEELEKKHKEEIAA